jgi:type II secretory pathway pseudopilin PulG
MSMRLVPARFRFWRGLAVLAAASAATLSAAQNLRAQEPARIASHPSLARYFPSQDLVVYVEFDGLDGHSEAWKKTAAYRLFTETTTGAMYEAALPRLFGLFLARQNAVQINGRELTKLLSQLFRSGFAVGINRAGGTGPPRSFGLVIRGGAKGDTPKIVERLLRAGMPIRLAVQDIQKPGGRTVHELGTSPDRSVAWWTEQDDLVVSLISPTGRDAIIDALEGRATNAIAHPNRQALLRSEDAGGFEPVGLAFFDMTALPPLPSKAVSLGLDRIKRFDYRWGFQGESLLSIVGAVVPAPRTGIPAIFDQPTFDSRHLPPLPNGLGGFTVVSLDGATVAARIRESLAVLADPPGDNIPAPEQVGEALRAFLGVSLNDEILAHLGSRFTIYNVATRINAPSHILESTAQGLFRVPKMAIVAEVKNHDLLAKSIGKLVDHANQTTRGITVQLMGFNPGEIVRLKNVENGYCWSTLRTGIPIAGALRPTLLLGQKTLVLASTPAMARKARDLAESPSAGAQPSDNPLTNKLDWLPGNLTLLSVADTAQSVYPELIVGLPRLLESMIGSPMGFPFMMRMNFGPRGGVPDLPGAGPEGPLKALDVELIPDPDELRSFLFPSVHALVVDEAGIRFLSREAIPTLNPSTAVPIALAALVPSVQSAQQAALRAQSTNNLKQIGLALHNFLSANDHFPGDIRGKESKRLLSWRVAILPFIEQQALFNEFHLDEPWDSTHNKTLIAHMPATFAVPGASPTAPGSTFYRGFAGEGTLFDPMSGNGTKIASITDGTSNTIAVVEAKEAVPWTKPESELAFDELKPGEKPKPIIDLLGGHFRDGFSALFCDGSVRFIRNKVNRLVLRALITRNGGEVISSDAF